MEQHMQYEYFMWLHTEKTKHFPHFAPPMPAITILQLKMKLS